MPSAWPGWRPRAALALALLVAFLDVHVQVRGAGWRTPAPRQLAAEFLLAYVGAYWTRVALHWTSTRLRASWRAFVGWEGRDRS